MSSLSLAEEQATKEFVEIVNELRKRRNGGPLPWNAAVRFLMARKFDVRRAVLLYEQHEITRIREGLIKFEPEQDPLKGELDTGKFTILPTRDVSGAAIAVFTVGRHYPVVSSHQTTLQGMVYQLDIALDSIETQKNGLVFIYDMTESKYGNFDYDLSKKILTLLKGGYPARLKKVLIVTAPLWFKAPFKILRLFVREKLRDRVFTVNVGSLCQHIQPTSLPRELGGNLEVNHDAWLLYCLKSMSNRYGDQYCDLTYSPREMEEAKSELIMTYSTTEDNTENFANTSEDEQTDAEFFSDVNQSVCSDSKNKDSASLEDVSAIQGAGGVVVVEEEGANLDSNGKTDSASKHGSCASSRLSFGNSNSRLEVSPPSTDTFTDCTGKGVSGAPQNHDSSMSTGSSQDDSSGGSAGGMTIEEFVRHVQNMSRKGLYEEYMCIKNRAPDGTFDQARLKPNLAKNRYTDVLCYDHSRVKLKVVDDDINSDYINANFVDGYKQRNAFITGQGPLPKTYGDFWRMIWEQSVVVVVMTTRVVERGRTKCGQYWPPEEGSSTEYGTFTIHNKMVESHTDYIQTALTLTDSQSGGSREVVHLQFISWPDYGVPHSALAMLDFLVKIRELQDTLVQQQNIDSPPILVHCSAGIGRTGTLCTLDICLKQLEDVGTVNIRQTVEKIRSQRAYSIQMPDQYVFCHLALLEYAVHTGLLPEVDLANFDDSGSESE